MISLGTDPEIVAVASSEQVLSKHKIPARLLNKPIPAFFALDIQDPDAVAFQLPFGTLTPDGMAVEFTVEPTTSVSDMVARIGANIRTTRDILAQQGVTLSVEPFFSTDMWYIERLPRIYGDKCSLQVLGCAPDICIYPIELPERPDPRAYPYRTSGGHIHMQLDRAFIQDRVAVSFLVAALDEVIGTAATYLCNNQQAYQRKILYGSAGMIRINNSLNLLEYRTLPAQALIQTPELTRMMFTAAQQIAQTMSDMYKTMPQPEAVREWQRMFGTFDHIIDTVVPAVNTHTIDACRVEQERVAQQLPIIAPVVNELCQYTMPDGFEVLW